jgi:hypothetical protein
MEQRDEIRHRIKHALAALRALSCFSSPESLTVAKVPQTLTLVVWNPMRRYSDKASFHYVCRVD